MNVNSESCSQRFAVLAMIVGCLGLFGLSAYTATQRTKEIGIRKALGSSGQGIFILVVERICEASFFIYSAIRTVSLVLYAVTGSRVSRTGQRYRL